MFRHQRSVNSVAAMLSILLLACVVASAFSADITDNKGPEIVGDYQLVYVWPKTTQAIPNCYKTSYSYRGFEGHRVTCDCKRNNPNLALLWQNTKWVGKAILFDIVGSFDEAKAALSDSCTCEPFNFNRVQAQMLSDNLLLEYEQEEILRHYIFAKTIPTEAEIREAITSIKDLKYEDGMSVCK
ncbi:uncharacterized protein LOC121733695 [Aricia agestis]|uniref:uncharacterized protein LOC121733695 n=1 Tax=Aricia agestis TaxID=91739 RepID=UPI001C20391A|nr:uncharacterized protein LOC121733695 [Aricia agestis]